MPIFPADMSMIRLSYSASGLSHDPNRQVGVVIADVSGVISTGTNRPPLAIGYDVAATLRSITEEPESKYYTLEHAERNAIFTALNAGRSLAGSTMYGTLFPCADCARAIVAVGIKRLVIPRPGADTARDQRWLDHYKYSDLILHLAGVEVDYFDLQELDTSGPIDQEPLGDISG